MKILVTGGCGFIGSNYIRQRMSAHPDDEIVNVDALTYAGNLENLSEVISNPNYRFVLCDISKKGITVHNVVSSFGPDAIINFAAESHVDRSIENPEVFLNTNVIGTQNMLNVARKFGVKRFLQISTDEVYGSLGSEGKFTETTPVAPRSPYSASKAAADHIAMAYFHTYGLPVVVTRCSNNYGPYQFPEKLIPLMIVNAMNYKELPVYGDGLYVRDWLHVYDHCSAIDAVLDRGVPGQVYNIGGNNEVANIDLIDMLLKMTERPRSLVKHVADRPGHDRRYAIDSSKIQNDLGWKRKISFGEGLAATIDWYLSHPSWWQKIISGEYRHYYSRMYTNR